MNQTRQSLIRHSESHLEILRIFGIKDTSLNIEDCTECQWCSPLNIYITFGDDILMHPDDAYEVTTRHGVARHELDGFVAFVADEDNGWPSKLYVFDAALECSEELDDDGDEVKYRLKAGF